MDYLHEKGKRQTSICALNTKAELGVGAAGLCLLYVGRGHSRGSGDLLSTLKGLSAMSS